MLRSRGEQGTVVGGAAGACCVANHQLTLLFAVACLMPAGLVKPGQWGGLEVCVLAASSGTVPGDSSQSG